MELVYSGFAQHFLLEGNPFIPQVFTGEGPIPFGFNAALVRLDASEHASLKWKIEEDYPLILWELELGLSEAIASEEPRLLALELAVEHFTEALYPAFAAKTLGVALYRGAFNEALLQPLQHLASRLPVQVRPFVFLDTDSIADAEGYFRCINQLNLGSLNPILKGKWPQKYPYALPAIAWEHDSSPLGFVASTLRKSLPEKKLSLAALLSESGELVIPESPCRVIPEALLTQEWDGVDELIVPKENLTEKCQRKLRGFEAAGGVVIVQ